MKKKRKEEEAPQATVRYGTVPYKYGVLYRSKENLRQRAKNFFWSKGEVRKLICIKKSYGTTVPTKRFGKFDTHLRTYSLPDRTRNSTHMRSHVL